MVSQIRKIRAGVDISARWFDVCIELPKSPLLRRRFDNDEAGVEQFIEWLLGLGARRHHVCMEFTGGREALLATSLWKAGVQVSLVDGFVVRQFRLSIGKAKAKTDPKDAQLLLRFLKERGPATWSPRPQEYRELTDMVRHRDDLIESRKAWECRVCGGTSSLAVEEQRQGFLALVRLQIEQIDKAIRAHIAAHEHLKKQVRLLTSIPGIATTSAVRILAEVGPITNYSSARELALAAGLAPICDSSGAKTSSKLRVYGNVRLRNALYMPILVSMRPGKGLHAFIDRVKANGAKNKMTIITAGMRKLIHVIYGVLSREQEFRPETLVSHMKVGMQRREPAAKPARSVASPT
jgi:transposase